MGTLNGSIIFADCMKDAEWFQKKFECKVCRLKLPVQLKNAFPKKITLNGSEVGFPTKFRSFRRYTGAKIFVFPFYVKSTELSLNQAIDEITEELCQDWDIGIFPATEFNVFFGDDVDKKNASILLFEEILPEPKKEEITDVDLYMKSESPTVQDVICNDQSGNGPLGIAPPHRSSIYGTTPFNRLETFLRFAYFTCKDIDSTDRAERWPKAIREATAQAYSIISSFNHGIIDCD
jgi:hypothetical protein